MTLKEFTELLGIHGADLSKWPNDRRDEVADLLAQSEAAKAALAEAAELDAALRPDDAELSPERKQSLVEEIMDSLESSEADSEPLAEDAGSARRGRNRA